MASKQNDKNPSGTGTTHGSGMTGTPGSTHGTTGTTGTTGGATGAVESAKDAMGRAADKVKETASQAAATASRKASEAGSYLGQKAEDAAAAVGQGARSFAGTIRDKGPHEGMLGSATASVADTLESYGQELQEHGLSGIADDLTNTIRRHPVPAVLIGIGLGFLLAQTLSSSRS